MRIPQVKSTFIRWFSKIGVVLFLFLTASMVYSQEEERNINLNEKYYSLFAFGAGYNPLNLLYDAGGSFNVNEFTGFARVNLKPVPWLGIFLRGGMIGYDGTDQSEPEKWDNSMYYGGFGPAFQSHISKSFEFGAELYGGLGYSRFPGLVSDAEGNPVVTHTWNFVSGAALKLTLNPTFNLSIDIAPSIRLQQNLGALLTAYAPMTKFDGFAFGIGISLSYRTGKDPDSPVTDVRALRVSKMEMPPMFAAMQSIYAKNPVTDFELTNTEKGPVTDVEIAFYQAGFMDSPTPSRRIKEIGGGETVSVPIFASFNREVFTTVGVTPLTGEIIINYNYNGRSVEQRTAVTYDLYDRNAISWTDDRKVAAFVTQSDSAIRNYASYIRTSLRDMTSDFVSEPLQFAMQSYISLAEQGLLYQVDPGSPFTAAQENPVVVDSVSLPRETLKRITGDCDDISVLYNTILESAGVETAFITTPGHIYSAVNTKVSASEYDIIHPNRKLLIIYEGTIWVPIEITLIGSANFLEAWETGARQWYLYEENSDERGFYRTSKAQEVYRPVGLIETDLGLQYADEDKIRTSFEQQYAKFADIVLTPYVTEAEEENTSSAWNKVGIRSAQLGRYETAKSAFRKATELKPDNIGPLINLGSVEFLEGSYQGAYEAFQSALNRVEDASRVRKSLQLTALTNLAKTSYQLENYDEAREYYLQATEIDPEQTEHLSYITSGSSAGVSRASEAASGPPILFSEDTAGE